MDADYLHLSIFLWVNQIYVTDIVQTYASFDKVSLFK